MSGRVELFLACDLWRSYACEGRTALVIALADVAQGEARLRRRARDEDGWTQEAGEDGKLLDACPACSYARFAAEVDGVPVPPPRPEYRLPATLAEAAQRHRRRAAPPRPPPGEDGAGLLR